MVVVVFLNRYRLTEFTFWKGCVLREALPAPSKHQFTPDGRAWNSGDFSRNGCVDVKGPLRGGGSDSFSLCYCGIGPRS